MTEHEYTLVIEGDLSQEGTARALYEAGCDDATFGVIDGMGYGDFTREAATLADAVLDSIHEVESVDGLRVVRVEPDDFVTMADIAVRLDRSRESIRLLIAGRRGPGNFPPPISHGIERNRLWRWSDVARWFEQLEPEDIEDANFVAAVNAGLDLRRHRERLLDDLTIKRVRELIES
ncbi:MAG: helix-turn-helix transcriptional regulator [Acidimicrobiales bacterium]